MSKRVLINERQRISQLAKNKIVKQVGKRRLPIIKIKPSDFTSQSNINQICQSHHTLIICHGRAHHQYNYLPLPGKALCLDINPVCAPDLLGNIRSSWWINNFPHHHFRLIWLMYLPPPSPFVSKNLIIFRNLSYLLAPGGKVKSYYLPQMYQRSQYRKKFKTHHDLVQEISFNAQQFGFSIQLKGGLLTMTKK